MFQGRSTARASYGQYVGRKQSQVRILLTQVDSQVQAYTKALQEVQRQQNAQEECQRTQTQVMECLLQRVEALEQQRRAMATPLLLVEPPW